MQPSIPWSSSVSVFIIERMAVIHSLKCTVQFSFVVPLLSLCYSLPFIVTRCVTRCHSLSFDVTRCTIRLSFYKWSVNCVDKACVFLQIRNKWIVVSSSHLQKEHSGELILLSSNSFLFRYKTLCKLLYWNICILESVVTILGKIWILSHSKTCPAKTFLK